MTALPTRTQSAEVAEFLEQLKPTVAARTASGRGRLIFALDATASREPTWDRAAQITHEMFDATAATGGLDTQLCFFRGCGDCKTSRWVSSATDLHRLMRGVRCEAGVTQIERILRHALREVQQARVSAVVFIGDAMEENGTVLRQLASELGGLKVPLFLFLEGSNSIAEEAFRGMALASGGAYLAFSLAGIAALKELLGAVAVYATGGRQALEAYSKKQGGEVLRLTAQMQR